MVEKPGMHEEKLDPEQAREKLNKMFSNEENKDPSL